jgi:hypothetical protein
MPYKTREMSAVFVIFTYKFLKEVKKRKCPEQTGKKHF